MNATQVFETCGEAAKAASRAIASLLRHLIEAQGRAVLLLDCTDAPTEFLASIIAEPGIDWTQIIVTQAAEFEGQSAESNESCQRFLNENLISRVPIMTFHAMRGDAPNQQAAKANLSARLSRMPPDVSLISKDLFDALQAIEESEEQIVSLRLNGRPVLAFTPATYATSLQVVLGQATETEAREGIGTGVQKFLYTSS